MNMGQNCERPVVHLFRYASGATIQILLFAIIAVQLRVRAPGAKTYLRVIHSHFGTKTHKVYVVFAFATNLIVTAMLMAGGAAVANGLVKDCSVALASAAVAAIVACYTLVGGMGKNVEPNLFDLFLTVYGQRSFCLMKLELIFILDFVPFRWTILRVVFLRWNHPHHHIVFCRSGLLYSITS